jgi:two-component system NtrC family response regulator
VTEKPPTLLVVDDDEIIRTQLAMALQPEYRVLTAGTAADALQLAEEHEPHLITLDLTLSPEGGSPEEGLTLLGRLIDRHPACKIIMITGNDDRAYARRAVEQGAWDYYEKPIDPDELGVMIRRALHVRGLEEENLKLRAQQMSRITLEEMVGDARAMREVYEAVCRVAPTDLSVLITGENGTGKELVAQAIHRRSPRRDGPFVAINCGAVPSQLLESELFGHEKGAFTSAHRRREGKLQQADGGSVFLDEVAEFPPELQVKMLRFLQDRTIQLVGGTEHIPVDARILAATNRLLSEEIATGRFREDFYYRLGVVVIHLPPLRDRGEDIMLLAQHFLARSNQELGKRIAGFTRGAIRAVEKHHWPGNVRELENRVKRAVVMARRNRLTPADLELEAGGTGPGPSLGEARHQLERRLLIEALRRNAGNVSRTARDLAVSRATIHDLMRKYGVSVTEFRTGEAPGE